MAEPAPIAADDRALSAAILGLDAAVAWRDAQRERGRRIVFTNGVFDLLHAGHVSYLAWARSRGDALIVGLNSDDSVRALKGALRPIVAFDERARVLAALRSVDLVVGFSERTPEAMLERLRPDVHVKSAQYTLDALPERGVVERGGGIVELAPHVPGVSTTDLVGEIRRRYGG
jgi:rfaE bifunctional protein nucleotidyltransferase chain/domain